MNNFIVKSVEYTLSCADKFAYEEIVLDYGYDGKCPYISTESLKAIHKLAIVFQFDHINHRTLLPRDAFKLPIQRKIYQYQNFFGDIDNCTFNIESILDSLYLHDFVRVAKEYNKEEIKEFCGKKYYPQWMWFEIFSRVGFPREALSKLYMDIVKLFDYCT